MNDPRKWWKDTQQCDDVNETNNSCIDEHIKYFNQFSLLSRCHKSVA